VNVAVHPSGTFIAVLHCGYGKHEIEWWTSLRQGRVYAACQEAFYGITFSPDGSKLYCSGARKRWFTSLRSQMVTWIVNGRIQLHDSSVRAIPAGIAMDKAGQRLYVANVWGTGFEGGPPAEPVLRIFSSQHNDELLTLL